MWIVLAPYVFLVLLYIVLFRVHRAQPPPGTFTSAIFKCLPIMYLLLLMLLVPKIEPRQSAYRYAISLGYVFSLCGDWCLNWYGTHFIHGLGSFAIALMCYIYSFGFNPFGGFTLLMFTIAAICMVKVLLPAIQHNQMKAAVLFYIALLVLAGWRSTAWYKDSLRWDSWMAMAGTLFFILSDTAIAINKWKVRFPWLMLFILVTYYTAQLMYAVSVLIPVFEAARRIRFMGV